MNRSLIEQEVARVFRVASLSSSDREVRLEDPLGDLGLGLDSLALVEFVTALEQAFRLPMPDDIWTARGQLTLNHFVEIVAESRSPDPTASPREDAPMVPVVAPAHPPSLSQSRERKRTLLESLSRTLRSASRLYYIVEFKLSEQPIPVYSPRLELSLRRASLDDANALAAFWESLPDRTFNKEKMTLELFQSLLESGHTCYAAWHEDEVVGWDWVWERGFSCAYTGLRLDWPRDTCYAGELREHERYRGRGIGLALLAFSLGEARKSGYARQVCWVDARNRKMLSGAIQLFGFQLIGEIRRRGRFPVSLTSWRHGRRAGFGRSLIL